MADDKKGGGSEGGYFGRFVFALLATVVTILIVQSSFSLIVPDVGRVGEAPSTFFRDFGASLGRMQFPGLPGPPGVPDYLRDLFAQPTAPTGPTTLPPSVTPPTPPKKEGIPGWVWALIAGIVILVLAILAGPRLAERVIGRRTSLLQQIMNNIDETIRNKTNAMVEIMERGNIKSQLIQRESNNITDRLEGINDPAQLWERVRDIEEVHPLKQLSDMELQLLESFENLKIIEANLYRQLSNLIRVLRSLPDITQQANEIRNLIIKTVSNNQEIEIRRSLGNLITRIFAGRVDLRAWQNEAGNFLRLIGDNGIIRLIVAGKDFVRHEIILEQNLQNSLKQRNVEELINLFVRRKFNTIKIHAHSLHYYDHIERQVIILLNQKIHTQITLMQQLRNRLTQVQQQAQAIQQQAAAAQVQAAAQPQPTTIKIMQPQAGSNLSIGGNVQLEAHVFDQQRNPVNDLQPHNMTVEWTLTQGVAQPVIIHNQLRGTVTIPVSFNTGNATLRSILRDNAGAEVGSNSKDIDLSLPILNIGSPAPNSQHQVGVPIRGLQAETRDTQNNVINPNVFAALSFVWYIRQEYMMRNQPVIIDPQTIHTGPTGDSRPIPNLFATGPTNPAQLGVMLLDQNRNQKATRAEIDIILETSAGGQPTVTSTPTPIVSTKGNVHIRATLNGNTWPDPPIKQERLTSEITTGTTVPRRRMYVPANIINWPVGNCTAVFIDGGPTGASLTSITPSGTQTLAPGGHITFTFNFVTVTGGSRVRVVPPVTAPLSTTPTANPPVADFDVTPPTGEAPLDVQFIDKSTDATFWVWSIVGSPPFSIDQDPGIRIFKNPGRYTVKLIASNRAGNNEITKEIIVLPSGTSGTSPTGAGVPPRSTFKPTEQPNQAQEIKELLRGFSEIKLRSLPT